MTICASVFTLERLTIWPGEAALNVSMVNWIKGPSAGPHCLIVDDEAIDVSRIATHLQLHTDVSRSTEINANEKGTTMGVIFGHEAFRSGSPGFPRSEEWDRAAVRPMAAGDPSPQGEGLVKMNAASRLLQLDGGMPRGREV